MSAIRKGNKVEAKWPGSSVYYPATVLQKSGKDIKVEFDNGTVDTVKLYNIRPSRSSSDKRQTRSRSRSTGKVTKRSPSRSPLRKQQTPKPERRSTRSRTPERKSKANHADKSKNTEDRESKIQVSSTSVSNSRSERIVYTEVKKDTKSIDNESTTRTSARIAALQATKSISSMPLGLNESSAKARLYLEREEEEEVEEESGDETDGPERKTSISSFHVGSFLWAMVKILLPSTLVLFLCLACSRKQCSIYNVPTVYNRWQDFQSDVSLPLLGCTVFHLALMVLSKLPIGRQVSGFTEPPKDKLPRKYRLNGIYLLLTTMAAFGALFYFNVNVKWGFDKIRPIVISCIIYTFLWSLILHFYGLLRKHDLSEERPSHRAGFLGDFYYGLEVNPFLFGREDVKTRFIQFGLIGLVLLDMSILTNFVLTKTYLPVPLGLIASMHLIFVLDYFFREESMLSTATYKDDGVGCGFIMGIGCVLPCSFVMQTIFLCNEHVKAAHLPNWCSVAMATLFLCGYYIYNRSSCIKHNFRKMPFSPSLSYLDSIPTSKKKRLIVNSWFGFLRHPNYLGLIVMAMAMSLTCGFTHVLPYFPVVYLIQLLVLRTFKVERACLDKYGPAWTNYSKVASKRLIPYIF